ncbi:Crp/Fnr family transcriptional regulator [Pedobacter roseus]|uniref:Crp/Fnr family transcriptional regulator n=1 Tax=Pedobacter roseus TaxID=336820 RepID=A0A7G9QH91_9SPHI|nr:Crp/Fnr family transcriptional regulator [Pedobacter roseus]QNN42716.1 Crp/Fnr family transcriptional regulator [Pedobacter roseus]
MNGEDYTLKLSAFNPLSAGLKTYIATIAQKIPYLKGQALFISREKNLFFPLIEKGTLHIIAIDKDTDEEIIIGTNRTNDFLYHFAKIIPGSRYELYVEFLEDSSIIAISEKHFANLMKLFFDAYLLDLNFTSFHFNRLFATLFKINKIE